MTPASGRAVTVTLVGPGCTQDAGHHCLGKGPLCSACGALEIPINSSDSIFPTSSS